MAREKHDFNAHRPLALDDDLDAEFTARAPSCIKSLTVQYDKMLYLIEDTEYSRRAIGKYIDVWHYPDGHKELRLHGVLLPYSTYDRLSEVDPSQLWITSDLAMCWMLPVRSRENETIIAHNRYLLLVMSLPADGTRSVSTNRSVL